MSERAIGVAVIGLGMAVAPHARSLLDLQLEGRVRIVGAWSRSEERRAPFHERFGIPVVDDVDALIGHPEVDVVLLVTPPDAREDLVRQAAAAGKHVLMEKPVERTTAAAERLVATCEAAGVTLGVVLQHRFREAAQELRRLLAEGALGEIATVEVAVPWWREQAYYDQPGRGTLARDGGGVLISQAIHTLDLMLSLAGPVAEVAAVAGTSRLHRMETEDFVGGGLMFANGAMGSLYTTTAAFPGGTERLVLNGTKGSATLAGGTLELRLRDGTTRSFGESGGSGGGADPMAFSHEAHKALIGDFIDAVRERRAPRVTGREALKVHRLIDALLRSAAEGRRVPVVAA